MIHDPRPRDGVTLRGPCDRCRGFHDLELVKDQLLCESCEDHVISAWVQSLGPWP